MRHHEGGRPQFLPGAGLIGGSFKIDLAALAPIWKRFESIKQRRFQLDRPMGLSQPIQPARLPFSYRLSSRLLPVLQKLGCFGWMLIVACFFMLYLAGYLGLAATFVFGTLTHLGIWFVAVWGQVALDVEKKRRKEVYDHTQGLFDAVVYEGEQLIRHYQKDFPRLRTELTQLRKRFESLQDAFEAECPRKNVGPDPARQAQQLEQYLRQQFLDAPENKITGIGPGRVATLASYGVETAFDISEEALKGIKGFGPKLTETLLSWKNQVATRFVYNPEVIATDEAPAELVLKYRQLEEGIRGQLQRKIQDLETLGSQVEEQLRSIQERLEKLAVALVQAGCDWQAAESAASIPRRGPT